MKKISQKVLPLILLYLLLFLLPQPTPAQDTLFLKNYLPQYPNFALATHQALKAAKKQRAKYLVLPKGTHHYYPDQAHQQYVKMSNNINGMKRIAFPLESQQNLTILGQDAKIILHGTMMGMTIHNCQNIVIQDLSFDWATPFYLQGKVITVDKDKKSYTVKFGQAETVEVINNDLVVRRPERDYFIGRTFWFDEFTKAPIYNLERRMNRYWNPYKPQHYQLTQLDAHTVEVVNTIDSLPSAGMTLIAKWRNQPNVNRIAPSIHIQQSEQIRLGRVAIHSAAGMGIIGEKSSDITLEKVQVVPTPDSDRVISTTADATHFVNCRGLVQVENCLFEASMDDGLNIHGNYTTVREKIDDHTLLAEVVHIQQEGFVFAGVGDMVALIDPTTLLPIADSMQVKSVELINDQFFKLTFEEALPDISNGIGLENLTWNADLIFRNNTVQRNWARGVLFKTGGKILIEDNYFAPSMSGLRNWGEMNFFNESGRVTDVTIQNNTFQNVCRVNNGKPAIVIFPQIKQLTEGNDPHQFYNRNIRITQNTFHTFDKPILFAKSVAGLVFSDNKIIVNRDYPPLQANKPVIEIQQCVDVKIEGNEYRSSSLGEVVLDNFSKPSILMKRNKNLKGLK
ncbi:MAG: right-handed parallel beta-helix repeat-containing protein [Bacteroidota bacterium]